MGGKTQEGGGGNAGSGDGITMLNSVQLLPKRIKIEPPICTKRISGWNSLGHLAKYLLNYLPQKCHVLRDDFADHQRYQVRLACCQRYIALQQLELGDRGEVLGARRTKAKELPSRLVFPQSHI